MRLINLAGAPAIAEITGVIIRNDDAWIYDWYETPYTSPSSVKAVLDGLKGEPLTVRINSGGGELFAGSEIYSMLRGYKGTVTVEVTGLAASAASVIAMAASPGKLLMSPTASIMIHNVQAYGVSGDVNDVTRAAEMLKSVNKSVAAAYVQRTGMTEEEVLELMDKETWLSAQEAIDLKLADDIISASNSTAPVTPAMQNALKAQMKALYHNSSVNQRMVAQLREQLQKPELQSTAKPNENTPKPQEAADIQAAKAQLALEKIRY